MAKHEQNLRGSSIKLLDFVSFLQKVTIKTNTSPKNDCNFTLKLPNLMNDISNKTYRCTESKEVKNLWSKAMSSSELKFFTDTFIFGGTL